MKKRWNYIYLIFTCLLLLLIISYTSGQQSREVVHGYYVHEVDGETTEDEELPEDVVEEEDIPEDVELLDGEIYIGTEEVEETEASEEATGEEARTEASEEGKASAPTASSQTDLLRKSAKASAAEIKKEEKALGLTGKVSYYHYNQLSENDKTAYRQILTGLKNHEYSFPVEVARADLHDIFYRVMYDHPELFWVDNGYCYWDYSSNRNYVKVSPTYNRTASEAKADQKKINKVINKIVKKASKQEKTYEKIKYVYKYLIRNTDYVANSPDNQNIYSTFINKKTVCAGYTRATQILLQKMGISAIYVRGYTNDGGSHSWNIVKMGKKYYQMDTTWGDPNYHHSTNAYIQKLPEELQYDYEYLLIDDKSMFKSRKQDTSLKLPSCTDNSKSFYRYNKRYFDSYGDKLKKSIRKNIKAGKNYWHGQMADKKSYQKFLSAVKNGLYADMVSDIKGGSRTTYYQYFDDLYVIKLYY